MKKVLSSVICIMLSAIMIISSSAAIVDRASNTNKEFGDEFTLGDIDNNGSINAIDSYALKSYVVGNEIEISEDAADFDANDIANSRDGLLLKACLAGQKNLSDYDSNSIIYSMTIAGNSIADYDIVYTDDFVLNADIQTSCGRILRRFVYTLTNYAVDIQDYIGTGEAKHHIYIKRMDPLASEEERMGLGIEDYIYEVRDGDLYIYGTLRGPMYAIYEILEEYYGINFYCASATYFEKIRTADIPEGTYVYHEAPHVVYRASGLGTGYSNQYSFYFANRMNGSNINASNGAEVGYLTGCVFDNAHTFGSTYKLATGYAKLLEEGYSEEYLKSNIWNIYPYGSDKNVSIWQPCASTFGAGSEFETMYFGLSLIFECYGNMGYDIQKMIDLGTLRQSFSMCDNGNSCACRFCKAKITGTVLKNVREAAVNIAVEGYSGYYEYNASAKTIQFGKEGGSGLYVDFVNHALVKLQETYPGATLWTILYDHSIPETIRPQNGLGIMYCGHGCINHALGVEDCGDGTTVLGGNNNLNVVSAKWWAEEVHKGGGQIWFWSYVTNYSYSFCSTPDIYELYLNFHYLCQECNFDGFFMEGCGYDNNFENLKAYITAKLCWNPDLTWDEFIDVMAEFLEMYYGSSEELLQYIDMQQQAGDANPCFVTNHDRPWDFYSWEYLNDHYEEMRGLLETALSKAKTDYQKHRVQLLIYSCDFMGLSSAWERLYLNGSAEDKALVEQRYTELYNYFDKNLKDNPNEYQEDPYPFPDELDLTICPMNLFYSMGAWRTELIPDFAK